MSFVCGNPECLKPVTGVKPFIQVHTRTTTQEGWKKTDDGKSLPVLILREEISREIKLCPTCSGVTPRELKGLSEGLLTKKLVVRGSQDQKVRDHRRGCKALLSECVQCQRYIEMANELPLPLLSEVLEQPIHPALRAPIFRSAVEAAQRRVDHNSQRATRDVQAAAEILAPFERRFKGAKMRPDHTQRD